MRQDGRIRTSLVAVPSLSPVCIICAGDSRGALPATSRGGGALCPGLAKIRIPVKNPLSRSARAAEQTQPVESAAPSRAAARNNRRGRRWPVIAGVSALAVLGSGAMVASSVHKTVQLDVDGQVTKVSTWTGSVKSLLAENNIKIGDRDVVAPGLNEALNENGDVVVRYARQVTVADASDETMIWTTALDADEVLATLADRGDSTHLVASRNSERTEIGIPLPADETVNVVADGKTQTAPAGLSDINAVLTATGIDLGELDRVTVARLHDDGSVASAEEAGTVTVAVARVAIKTVTVKKKLKNKSVTKTDAERFVDLPTVIKTAGAKGVRTIKHEVTYVDGVEESRTKLSNEITKKPVTKVSVKGSKARPVVVVPPAPPARESGNRGGSGNDSNKSTPKNQGNAPSSGVWAKLAQCESGGRVNAVSASGAYHGLYQFSVATWRGVGGSGLPSQASAGEQTKRAKMLQARSGWGQWPACSAKLGLR